MTELDEEEKIIIKRLQLLTTKPIIYVLNTDDNSKKINNWDGEIINLNIKTEEEIANLDKKEQEEFIKELGLEQSGLDKLIQASYKLLGLMSFFTTGKDETRAWTIKKETKAPQAAGVIHTDFEKGFIRAEVINFKDFIEQKGETSAREKGLIHAEGKDYIMQDGDICNFLVN